MPRGRLIDQDGNSREFRSEIVPRYARRTLGGVPGRGEHAADPQGTVAVARSGAPVQERDLSEQRFQIAYLDGLHVKEVDQRLTRIASRKVHS